MIPRSPLLIVPHAEATTNINTNPAAFWSGTVGKVHAGRFAPHIEKKTLIKQGEPVWAIGSCFADEIQDALAARQFTVLTNYGDEPTLPPSYLRRFNVPSMLLEFRRCLEDFPLRDTELVVETDDGRFRDTHYSALIAADDMDQIHERRAAAARIFRSVRHAKLVVLTLGLNEMWFDPDCGHYLNTWADLDLIRKRPSIEVRVLSVAETVECLGEIHALLLRFAPQASILVTVSPVPLYATFTDDDVAVANSRSKTILHAAAIEFCAAHPDIVYFPSYEIATHSAHASVFTEDGRHVQRAMADHIIGLFCKNHVA